MNLTIRQNTTNFALSQYTDFFFDRGFCNIGGKNIALKCDALCELGGSTDAGAYISAKLQTGAIAFGDGEKRVRSIHVKGQFDNANSIAVKYAMDSFTPDLSCAKASTSKVGASGSGSINFQGVRARHGEHLTVLVDNVNGAYFFIKSIVSFLIKGSRR